MTKRRGGDNRRKFRRADEKIASLYKSQEAKGLGKGSTVNIGAGGVCLETEIYVPPQTEIEIQLNKPIDDGLGGTFPIHANAKVIWIKQAGSGKYRMGLEFLNVREKHRDEIIRNVERKIKETE